MASDILVVNLLSVNTLSDQASFGEHIANASMAETTVQPQDQECAHVAFPLPPTP